MKTFADIAFANEYFAYRAFSEAWDNCTDKEKFLSTASQMIADYAVFPEIDGIDYDLITPEWLKRAACEQALYLAALGKDPTQADRKTTLGVASADGTVFDKSFAADILSPTCRRIIIQNGGAIMPGATSGNRHVGRGNITK